MIPMFHCMALLDGGAWKFQRLGMKVSIFNQTFEETVQLDLKGERVDWVEQCWGDLGRCLPAGCQDAFGLVSGHMIACLIGKEWLPIPKSLTNVPVTEWSGQFPKAVSYLHICTTYTIVTKRYSGTVCKIHQHDIFYKICSSFQCTTNASSKNCGNWVVFPDPVSPTSTTVWLRLISLRNSFLSNTKEWNTSHRGSTGAAAQNQPAPVSPGFPSWQLLSLLQNLIVTLRFHCTKKKPSGRAGRYFCWLSLPISSHFPWTKFWSNWTKVKSRSEKGLSVKGLTVGFSTLLAWHHECSPDENKNLPWRMLAFFAGGSPFWVTSAPFWVSMAGTWPRNRNKP